jgi:RNA polymerase sigma-70 factor, ECF subfamily
MAQDVDVPALVKRSRQGDRDAFSALVVRFQDDVYNIVLQRLGDREAAFDAAQETFVKAFESLGTFQGRSAFKSWLLAIALNEAENQRRKRRRDVSPAQDAIINGLADGGRSPSSSAEHEDDMALLHRVLEAADADDARLILLRDLENLSYSDIAEALSVPVGTVKSGIHRARLRLRAAFERGHEPRVPTAPKKTALPDRVA